MYTARCVNFKILTKMAEPLEFILSINSLAEAGEKNHSILFWANCRLKALSLTLSLSLSFSVCV